VYAAHIWRMMRGTNVLRYDERKVATLMNQPDGTAIAPIEPEQRIITDRVLDTLLAGALGALMLLETASSVDGLRSPAILLAPLALTWRRRQPLLVFLMVFVGVLIAANSAPYTSIIAIMVAAYSLGGYDSRRWLTLATILASGTLALAVFGGQLPPMPENVGPYALLVPFWLAGSAIQSRQVRADAFESKAKRLEREQELATQQAMAEERARIARELHDVVAHSVSVMVVQAGAARLVLKSAPDRAHDALLAVEASGREAMTELRHLLGVLSEEGDGISLTPQPGLDQVESLVRRVGEAGLPVCLHIEGQPRPLSPGVNLTAYRIVQEALTNALKYAGLARTEVILGYRDHELKVEILDEGCGALARDDEESGHGLVGMRERVALYGGTLEAGPRLERGYAVRAWLPFESGVA
jgi:signal transduction histidine kinase